MPASTVTVRAAGSSDTISFMGWSERKQSLLSAMWLKAMAGAEDFELAFAF